MSPTPELTCTACGEPVPADANACPGCGAMVGAPSSGFGLDPGVEPAPKRAPKPPPPPRVQEDEGPSEKTVAEKQEEKETEKPKGETVRMSLADATQAWMEDAPTTTAVIDESIDDGDSPAKSRALLFIVLGLVVAAAIALALLL